MGIEHLYIEEEPNNYLTGGSVFKLKHKDRVLEHAHSHAEADYYKQIYEAQHRYASIHGGSWFDFGKSVVARVRGLFGGRREDLPPSVREFKKQLGERIITSMYVGRRPIQTAVKTILNWISLGQFNENAKKAGYDNIYHLYLILILSDGQSKILEKNHVIKISDCPSQQPNEDRTQVQLNGRITVNELIDNTVNNVGIHKLVIYRPTSDNCQMFCNDVLTSNNLMTSNLQTFIMQIPNLLGSGKSGWVAQKFGDTLTHIASSADMVVHGGNFMDKLRDRLLRK